jgi:hypothetical protein
MIKTGLFIYCISLIILSVSCGGGGGGSSTTTATTSTDSVETVTYALTFTSEWSSTTHPTDFPSSAHYSGLIGMTHSSNNLLWQKGTLASTGIKDMAETGGKAQLSSEVSAFISAGTANAEISGSGISNTPGTITVTFTTDSRFPLVSVVSMIAPSPDWFVGVNSTNLMGNGSFVSGKTIDLFPYDAGTDSGSTYTSVNSVTSPFENIQELTGSPFLNGSSVQRLGQFVFTKQ